MSYGIIAAVLMPGIVAIILLRSLGSKIPGSVFREESD
jgi:hypothetical protein